MIQYPFRVIDSDGFRTNYNASLHVAACLPLAKTCVFHKTAAWFPFPTETDLFHLVSVTEMEPRFKQTGQQAEERQISGKTSLPPSRKDATFENHFGQRV
jgi:hypothetical protein